MTHRITIPLHNDAYLALEKLAVSEHRKLIDQAYHIIVTELEQHGLLQPKPKYPKGNAQP